MTFIQKRICVDCNGEVVLCAKCSKSLHCIEVCKVYRQQGDGESTASPFCEPCATEYAEGLRKTIPAGQSVTVVRLYGRD